MGVRPGHPCHERAWPGPALWRRAVLALAGASAALGVLGAVAGRVAEHRADSLLLDEHERLLLVERPVTISGAAERVVATPGITGGRPLLGLYVYADYATTGRSPGALIQPTLSRRRYLHMRWVGGQGPDIAERTPVPADVRDKALAVLASINPRVGAEAMDLEATGEMLRDVRTAWAVVAVSLHAGAAALVLAAIGVGAWAYVGLPGRGRRRLGTGRCPRCEHPLVGAVGLCTECGWRPSMGVDGRGGGL